jgi:hypothetical protein
MSLAKPLELWKRPQCPYLIFHVQAWPLSMLRGNSSTSQETSRPESSGKATPDGSQKPTRKRDQLKNAAVGGLATGVGWLLGAPPVRDEEE